MRNHIAGELYWTHCLLGGILIWGRINCVLILQNWRLYLALCHCVKLWENVIAPESWQRI